MYIKDEDKKLRVSINDTITIKKVRNPLTGEYSFLVEVASGTVLVEDAFITNDITINGIKLSTE